MSVTRTCYLAGLVLVLVAFASIASFQDAASLAKKLTAVATIISRYTLESKIAFCQKLISITFARLLVCVGEETQVTLRCHHSNVEQCRASRTNCFLPKLKLPFDSSF